MKVSYNQLQGFFEDKLPSPEALAEAFSFHFAEVESVEKTADDYILDVKVLPDRAGYAKSYEGIALEASTILNLKRKSVPVIINGEPRKFSIKSSMIRESLGMEVSDEEIISILKKLEIGVRQLAEGSGGELNLIIPSNRTDLQDWRDIPEEIGRIYGYDKIPANIPASIRSSKPDKSFYSSEKIRNILSGWGFSEVYTYSLTDKGVYHIEKSVASDKNYLRANLTDGINKSLELNARNADLLGLDEIKIFEIGKVFCEEGEHLALNIGIRNVRKKPSEGMSKEDWQEKNKVKKVRDELLKIVDANATILCTVDDSGGLISVGGKTIGITNSVEGVMEINLDALFETLPEVSTYDDLNLGKAVNIEYKKFSPYPFIVRDIAVLVNESIQADEVWGTIMKGIESAGAVNLLARHSLFDTFKKDAKVSYAYRIIFQSMDKTLTDDEVSKVMEKVSGEVKGKGWEVR